MATPKIDLLFNVTGQTLYLDCPEGRPSSITSVEVREDTDGDDVDAESALGSSSIESVDTTLDGSAGDSQSDRKRIPLTATTNIVAGRGGYRITNAYGQYEDIEIEKFESGVAAWSRTPLAFDYASGDTFVSRRASVAVADAWIQNEDHLSDPLCPYPRWRLVWKYVVGGVTYVTVQFFDVVRYPFVTAVTPYDLDQASRGLLGRLSVDDRAGQTLIAEAVEQVKLDLWERKITAYALRNSPILNELIKRKAVELLHEQAVNEGGDALTQLERATKTYWDRLQNLVSAANAAQQISDTGAGGATPLGPAWRR